MPTLITTLIAACLVLCAGCERCEQPTQQTSQPTGLWFRSPGAIIHVVTGHVTSVTPPLETSDLAQTQAAQPIPSPLPATEHALPKALPSPTSEDSTLLAHVTARTVKETNLRIVTNINLVYPDQPALESTNATFNFINIPIVVPTALTAEVSVSYFAGYIIPVMLSVNDRLVATNLCNLPSGWCAWRATNDLVGNIILTPGTNVVRLFRRGNMPNILEVFVRRAASLQTSETAPSSPLDVSSPPATSPN